MIKAQATLRMRHICLGIIFLFLSQIFYSPVKLNATNTCPWSVFFSPEGGCTEAIVREIQKARSAILVQAYSFTSAPIAQALMEAQKRGVSIEVILDKSNRTDKYSAATFLLHAGIPTRIDAAHSIAHNKIIIIDGETVITGSFNFTKAAEEKNAENLLIIPDKKLAEKYISNWKFHASHSEIYKGREGRELLEEELSNNGNGSKPNGYTFRFLPSPLQALQGSAFLWDLRGKTSGQRESPHLSFQGTGIDTLTEYCFLSRIVLSEHY